MMKRFIAILTLAALPILAAAQQTTGPLKYENEPAYYAQYRKAAAIHANVVTSATDVIRKFQQSKRFKDAFTSTALQDQYEAMITSQSLALVRMRRDLLTTATLVNDVAREQLKTMRAMNALKDSTFESLPAAPTPTPIPAPAPAPSRK